MSSEGILASVIILVAGVAWVALPLIMKRSKTRATQTTDLQHDRLLGLYERVLTTIRDLDEDYSTGKMPEESYRQERELWSQRGVEVLQALDEHGSKTTVPAKNGPS